MKDFDVTLKMMNNIIERKRSTIENVHFANHASDSDTINSETDEAPTIAILMPLNIGRILLLTAKGFHHPNGFALL